MPNSSSVPTSDIARVSSAALSPLSLSTVRAKRKNRIGTAASNADR